jgi:hypothetical protein
MFMQAEHLPIMSPLKTSGQVSKVSKSVVIGATDVNCADAGMTEGRGGPRLTLKPRPRLRILRDLSRPKLQGDESAQADVFGHDRCRQWRAGFLCA